MGAAEKRRQKRKAAKDAAKVRTLASRAARSVLRIHVNSGLDSRDRARDRPATRDVKAAGSCSIGPQRKIKNLSKADENAHTFRANERKYSVLLATSVRGESFSGVVPTVP